MRAWTAGLSLALLSLAAWPLASDAATYPAASCAPADINTAIALATVAGDVVSIPAGTCTCNSAITMPFNRGITLQGAGTRPLIGAATSGGTTLTINGSNDCIDVFEPNAGTANPTIANITFDIANGGSFPSPPGAMIYVGPRDNGSTPTLTDKMVIFDHVTVTQHQSTPRVAISLVTLRGLIYRSRLENDVTWTPGPAGLNNSGPKIECKGSAAYAPANWASASLFGTADTNGDRRLYIETSTFTNNANVADLDDGCKSTVRYNTFVASTLTDHGHDSSTHGNRNYEVYNNDFQCGTEFNITAWYPSRGGTGVITDNIAPGTCWSRSITRWAGTVQALRGQYYDPPPAGPPFDCFPGPYPWPRQVGWGWAGSGDEDSTVLEPLYIWNNKNTSGGTPGEADSFTAYDAPFTPTCTFDNSSQTSAGYIQSSRDYYLSVAKPSYTKFTYPHPLATVTGDGGGGGGGGSTAVGRLGTRFPRP